MAETENPALARILSGVRASQAAVNGPGAGDLTPEGSTYDVQTGELEERRQREAPEDETAVTEPAQEAVEEQPDPEVVAALRRLAQYVQRLRRQAGDVT